MTERSPDASVMVVGGAGFIGSHLVDRLVSAGRSVDVVDDLSSGSLANLADARSGGSDLSIHTLDAARPSLGELVGLRRPAVIYQLALLPPVEAPAVELGRSFTSMLATLDAARAAGVDKVVVALPATVLYGHPASRDLPVKEGTTEPRGVRGVVARAIVDLLAAYRERWGVEFTALAVATAYGARQRPGGGVVAAFVHAARCGEPPTITGDGRQTRDFVFVDDVVDALVRAGERGSGLVVNIGTGVATSVRDLWRRIAGATEAAVEPRHVHAPPDELARFAVSPVRARIHLDWSPWTTLDDGLAEVLRPA